MHGPERDYSPGGENEGKPGSSIELSAWNTGDARALTYQAVLIPQAHGAPVLAVRKEGESIRIGGDALRRVEGHLTLTKASRSELFTLW